MLWPHWIAVLDCPVAALDCPKWTSCVCVLYVCLCLCACVCGGSVGHHRDLWNPVVALKRFVRLCIDEFTMMRHFS